MAFEVSRALVGADPPTRRLPRTGWVVRSARLGRPGPSHLVPVEGLVVRGRPQWLRERGVLHSGSQDL